MKIKKNLNTGAIIPTYRSFYRLHPTKQAAPNCLIDCINCNGKLQNGLNNSGTKQAQAGLSMGTTSNVKLCKV